MDITPIQQGRGFSLRHIALLSLQVPQLCVEMEHIVIAEAGEGHVLIMEESQDGYNMDRNEKNGSIVDYSTKKKYICEQKILNLL
jgi:competence protein ComGC